MFETLALVWLYLVGLYVFRRLQDHTPAFEMYGVAGTWALLLIWPVSAPIGYLIHKTRADA